MTRKGQVEELDQSGIELMDSHVVALRLGSLNRIQLHCTMPWMGGTRYAVILFSVGTASVKQTPPLTAFQLIQKYASDAAA